MGLKTTVFDPHIPEVGEVVVHHGNTAPENVRRVIFDESGTTYGLRNGVVYLMDSSLADYYVGKGAARYPAEPQKPVEDRQMDRAPADRAMRGKGSKR